MKPLVGVLLASLLSPALAGGVLNEAVAAEASNREVTTLAAPTTTLSLSGCAPDATLEALREAVGVLEPDNDELVRRAWNFLVERPRSLPSVRIPFLVPRSPVKPSVCITYIPYSSCRPESRCRLSPCLQ